MQVELDRPAEDGANRARPDCGPRPGLMAGLYAAVGCLFTIARLRAVTGRPVMGIHPDSSTYRSAPGQLHYPLVSFAGRAMRPWAVPVFYAPFDSDVSRSAAQVALGIVAWLVLGTVVAATLKHRWVRFGAFAVVLAFGSTTQVVMWDRLILSESLAISLVAVGLAAWIRFATRPSRWNAAAVVVATACWTFTRFALFPLVLLMAIGVAVSMIVPRDRAYKAVVAGALCIVSIWGCFASARADRTYRAFEGQGVSQFGINFAMRLRYDVLNDPSRTAWFVDHGMPDPAGLEGFERSTPAVDERGGWSEFYDEYRKRRDLAAWVEEHGQSVYLEYVIGHAAALSARFVRELPYVIGPPRYDYGPTSRDVLPAPMQRVLFDFPSRSTAPAVPLELAAIVAVVVALAGVGRRTTPNLRFVAVCGGAIGIAFASFAIDWLIAVGELPRHTVGGSLLVRLSLWLLAFALLDACLAPRRSGGTDLGSSSSSASG